MFVFGNFTHYTILYLKHTVEENLPKPILPSKFYSLPNKPPSPFEEKNKIPNTPWKFYSSPPKIDLPNWKGLSSNHHFSGGVSPCIISPSLRLHLSMHIHLWICGPTISTISWWRASHRFGKNPVYVYDKKGGKDSFSNWLAGFLTSKFGSISPGPIQSWQVEGKSLAFASQNKHVSAVILVVTDWIRNKRLKYHH